VGLAPLDEQASHSPQGRLKSCIPSQEGIHPSRIDDIFVSTDLAHPSNALTIVKTSGDSDHELLQARVDISRKVFVPPPEPTPTLRKARLKTPVSPTDLEKFNAQLTIQAAVEIAAAERESKVLLQKARSITANRSPTTASKFCLLSTG
jgi:hypothetical protein